MAHMDVYASPDGVGYVVDVQADLLSVLRTRVVVPLLPAQAAPLPARQLNPVFDLEEGPCVLLPQFMATVTTHEIGHPVASLLGRRDDVIRALDLLLTGI